MKQFVLRCTVDALLSIESAAPDEVAKIVKVVRESLAKAGYQVPACEASQHETIDEAPRKVKRKYRL